MVLKFHWFDLVSKIADCSNVLVKDEFTVEQFNDFLIAIRTFNAAYSGLCLDDVIMNSQWSDLIKK